MVSRHCAAATLDPTAAKDELMPQFETEGEQIRRHVLALIRAWRQPLADEVWLQEVYRLSANSRRLLPCQDSKDAESMLHFFATVRLVVQTESAAVSDFLERALSRVTRAALADETFGPLIRLNERTHLPNRPHPLPGTDPGELVRGETTVTLNVRQQGRELAFVPVEPGDNNVRFGGSHLGFIRTTNRHVRVDANWKDDSFWKGGTPPPWADAWGRDGYGSWVTFRIGKVTQRLRWVPAGSFLMGSPGNEEDRHGDEGPQHEVTLTEGYWLFDTPCTQALWLAVMGGKNPSHFKGDRRPVEQVSFEDVGRFMVQLNGLVPGLDLSLPTESQWEYACRAGTREPRYGVLGDVAWYSENSGGQTHDVGQKRANGWGLYDMLGNVYEWCLDGQRKYTRAAITDPTGPTAGSARVIRGGGWNDTALYVRAAFRFAYAPGYRDYYVGFRCLSSGRQAPARVEPAAEVRGQAERGLEPEQAGGTEQVQIPESGPGRCRLPQSQRIRILSDLDELILERDPLPRWATAGGRDKFGLWAEFEVRDKKKLVVTQRLRWVPPGRFLMGSPASEEGRFDREGPQHEVTLTAGYWLFDTPCTQALWSAVMGGTNPSRFPDPRRPVEQVSFEDAGKFLAAINDRVPGLDLTLPTESQWEYACRAGTTTATYAGELKIVGDNNAPLLDSIAWYGGNSGHKYDLEEGSDSSSWPDKQYPHTKAGTRQVGQKLVNGWGLYDMLGNVYEWCLDGERAYTSDGAVDPMGPLDAGSDRVIRGGSWNGTARSVRAAYRIAIAPGNRNYFVGFRCLSSGRIAEPKARQGGSGSERGGSPRRPRPTKPGRAEGGER